VVVELKSARLEERGTKWEIVYESTVDQRKKKGKKLAKPQSNAS